MDIPPPPPDNKPTVKALLDQLDAHTQAMRDKKADDRAGRVEGVYMILFQIGLIASLGAMYGFVANARALAMRSRHRPLGFWEQRAQDATDCWNGLLRQLAEYWWLDAALFALMVFIALRISSRRSRSRWFKLMVLSTSLLLVLPSLSKLFEVAYAA